MLALGGFSSEKFAGRNLVKGIISAGIVLFLGLFLWGLIAHYYTPCGPSALKRENCRLPAYQNLEIAQPPQVKLKAEVVLEQEFDNTCADMRAVEVLIGDLPVDAAGALDLSLLDPAGGLVTSREYKISALSQKQILMLEVPAGTTVSRGKYTIHLEVKETGGGLGIGLRKPDVYPGGGLTVDGSAVDGDVVFFYTCAPGKGFKY